MAVPPFIAALRSKLGSDLLLVPTVVVIARDAEQRLLLVHDRDSDNWTLPGGIIEPGEAPADAAVREVWEETRVAVSLTHIAAVVGGTGCETHYRNGDRIAWVATVFAATVLSSRPLADGEEIQEARFVSPLDMPRLPLRADTVQFLAAERPHTRTAYFQPATWFAP